MVLELPSLFPRQFLEFLKKKQKITQPLATSKVPSDSSSLVDDQAIMNYIELEKILKSHWMNPPLRFKEAEGLTQGHKYDRLLASAAVTIVTFLRYSYQHGGNVPKILHRLLLNFSQIVNYL